MPILTLANSGGAATPPAVDAYVSLAAAQPVYVAALVGASAYRSLAEGQPLYVAALVAESGYRSLAAAQPVYSSEGVPV